MRAVPATFKYKPQFISSSLVVRYLKYSFIIIVSKSINYLPISVLFSLINANIFEL
jgi:hypothetical protein